MLIASLVFSVCNFAILLYLTIQRLVDQDFRSKLTPEGEALLMKLRRGGVIVRVLEDEGLMYRSPKGWNG